MYCYTDIELDSGIYNYTAVKNEGEVGNDMCQKTEAIRTGRLLIKVSLGWIMIVIWSLWEKDVNVDEGLEPLKIAE